MKTAVKYIFNASPFYVRWKKHFCPRCGRRVKPCYNSKIVNSKSADAEDYDFSAGDTFSTGDVEFREIYFHCPQCSLDISLQEMKKREKENQK